MESAGRNRLRECQIEQERRYERARKDSALAAVFGRTQKFYTINTDIRGMKHLIEM